MLILFVFLNVVKSGMSLRIEQVVTQLHQEVITLKAKELLIKLHLQTQFVPSTISRKLNQVRQDTSSLIDVKGLGRLKDFTGKKEDVQQWSKKTKVFSTSVIKESEMMLEWSAEQWT